VPPALSQGGPEEQLGGLKEEGDQENGEERRRGIERTAAPAEGTRDRMIASSPTNGPAADLRTQGWPEERQWGNREEAAGAGRMERN
jgi:hypothetical protein